MRCNICRNQGWHEKKKWIIKAEAHDSAGWWSCNGTSSLGTCRPSPPGRLSRQKPWGRQIQEAYEVNDAGNAQDAQEASGGVQSATRTHRRMRRQIDSPTVTSRGVRDSLARRCRYNSVNELCICTEACQLPAANFCPLFSW
ncbi:uncharacterized protein PV06_06772 [Exophiala oligosperma]|uniref:Uncharacterized protein n=1 Tax=Exophiala oligosperma TaxID=215243 RepID=A0A0D2DDQ5_9EURO|nr:uncharacterized protein PV06_06772 [Exophiala oligosperma]KIW41193.1 hypothetical protein PV06_06772 [Exophiala oligosperma]